MAPKAAPARKAVAATAPAVPQGIVNELHAMKELIEDRFNTLNWLGQARQDPVQANLMLKLIRAGYSPTLSRTILERMPETTDATEAARWVMDVLERNLRVDANATTLQDEGGIFALIGATGVGKTTTAAKLAGLCARDHGAGSVGLISLDTYRVGAQEQLRAYGKMLGVVAHLAHDKAALHDLLGLLSNKKMVLIDTTGLAPRDPRKREMMELLDLPDIKRLLVLNAGGHGDTLDDTVTAFKSPSAQQVILSKIDEAVKLGPAIDTCIRHQLVLRGVTTGQRVPEDWEAADPAKLVRASMRATGNPVHDPKLSDLGFIFSHSSDTTATRGYLDA
jgi:flagellar biosynthesis protein FlhF